MWTKAAFLISLASVATWSIDVLGDPPADNKITICHKAGPKDQQPAMKWVTITVSKSSWKAHQAHGDFMAHQGRCEEEEEPQ